MANTYTQIYIHVVFAVEGRQNLIKPENNDELQKYINEYRWVAGRFSWQEGFGAFSYSRSQLGTVIRYIENQQKHHAKKSFRDEYIDLLEKFGVDYDRRYVFKFDNE